MDFGRLNRRELQYLCKLNKIPANITNIAMAHSLKTLHIVEGLEEFLSPSQSESAGSSIESPEKIEVTSPRAPRTSCRTSTRQKVKKPEVENLGRTATRGVRKQFSGEVSDFLKTPSVASTRKKVLATASRQNVAHEDTMKKQNTVQSVYNTRRSARLMEKKCVHMGAIQREIIQFEKIDMFSDEVIATTEEESLGSDSAAEGSVESCDVGISKSTVEGICNAFEKLDVLVVDSNDQISTIKKTHPDTTHRCLEEKVESCDKSDKLKVKSEQHENADLEDRQNVAENLVLNDYDTSKHCNDRVPKPKPDSEAPIVSVNEHNLTNENVSHADSTFESEEKKVNCCRELCSINVTPDEIFEKTENVSSGEKHNVEENIVLNEVGTSDSVENKSKKDNLKPDSDISSSCEDEDLEEKLMVDNIQNLKIQETLSDPNPESGEEETHFCNPSNVPSLELEDFSLVISEKKDEDFIRFNSENPIDLSKLDTTKNDNVAQEMAVEGAIEENILKNTVDAVPGDYLNPGEQELSVDFGLHSEEEFDNIFKIPSDICFKNIEYNVAEGGDVNILEQHENVCLEDMQNVVENLVLNGQVHKLKPDESTLSSCEDEELEDNLMVVYEKFDPNEVAIVADSTCVSGERKVNICYKLASTNVTSAEIFEQQENKERGNVSENIVLNQVGISDSEENSGQKDNLKPDSDIISGLCEDGDLEKKILVSNIQNLKIEETVPDTTIESGEEEIDFCDEINYSKLKLVERFDKHNTVDLEDTENAVETVVLNEVVTSEENTLLIVADKKVDFNEALNVLISEQTLTTEKSMHPDSTFGSDEKKVDCCDELDSIDVIQVEIVDHYENVGEKFTTNEVDNPDSEANSCQIDNLKHNSDNISSSCEDGDLEENMNPDEKEPDSFSKSPVDAVHISNVNSMEQELVMSFEAPPEEQTQFTGDTFCEMVPTYHEEVDLNSEQLSVLAAEKTFVESKICH